MIKFREFVVKNIWGLCRAEILFIKLPRQRNGNYPLMIKAARWLYPLAVLFGSLQAIFHYHTGGYFGIHWLVLLPFLFIIWLSFDLGGIGYLSLFPVTKEEFKYLVNEANNCRK